MKTEMSSGVRRSFIQKGEETIDSALKYDLVCYYSPETNDDSPWPDHREAVDGVATLQPAWP